MQAQTCRCSKLLLFHDQRRAQRGRHARSMVWKATAAQPTKGSLSSAASSVPQACRPCRRRGIHHPCRCSRRNRRNRMLHRQARRHCQSRCHRLRHRHYHRRRCHLRRLHHHLRFRPLTLSSHFDDSTRRLVATTGRTATAGCRASRASMSGTASSAARRRIRCYGVAIPRHATRPSRRTIDA